MPRDYSNPVHIRFPSSPLVYWRQQLVALDDPEKLRASGLALVLEIEELHAWVREQGMDPPFFHMSTLEALSMGKPVLDVLDDD